MGPAPNKSHVNTSRRWNKCDRARRETDQCAAYGSTGIKFHVSEVDRLFANAEAEIEAEAVVDELHVTGHDDEFYEGELLHVLDTCRAIYAFEGDFDFDFIQRG